MKSASDQSAEFSEYAGVAAELYDALRGTDPLPGEYDFYRQSLGEVPGPHLEVGAGTGRILLRLLQDGLEVEGLESSADMLRICRQKAEIAGLAPVLHHQFMEGMALPKLYGSVFVPLVTLSLLRDRALLEGVLRRFHCHLRRDGQLLFSTVGRVSEAVGAAWWPTRETLLRGKLVRVSQETELEPGGKVMTERFSFETLGDDPALLGIHRLTLRVWSAREVTALLRRCGYERIQVTYGHRGAPPMVDNAILVFRARTAPVAAP